MISYPVYKVIHFIGIFMVFLSLGGVTMHVINGGAKEHAWRKPLAITHGVGLFLALLGGFGLLARLGIVHGMLPGWVLAKLAIWTVFAAVLGVVIRKRSWAGPLWAITVILGGVAAYLAGSKPF
jgi:hypothetical protein